MTLTAALLVVPVALWSAAPAFAEESNDGLPPGAPLPSWAVGRPIHFDPARTVGGVAEPLLVEPLVEARKLNYFEGPVEYKPALFLIFWGKNWIKEPGFALKQLLLKFYEGVKESSYQKILTQYDSASGRVSLKPGIQYIEDDERIAAPSKLNYEGVWRRAEETREIYGSEPNINNQYVVLPAPGSTYEEGFGKNFCGYHEPLEKNYGAYALVPYAGDPPFSEHRTEGVHKYEPCTDYGSASEPKYNAEYGTSGSASHEYAESATDPHPNNGWITKKEATEKEKEEGIVPEEIADLCGSEAKQQMPNGAWVSELWDNSKKACEISDETPVLQEIGPYTNHEAETTEYVTQISALLVGGVEPCGLEAHYYFEYGLTTSYGTKTAENTIPSETWGTQEKTAELSGLKPNTTYHWRVVVKTSAKAIAVEGADNQFTTPYNPAVQSKPATNVRATRATINGTVNPEGYATKYFFEYGTTESYGGRTAELSAGSGTANVEEGAGISGLSPGTAYHFRIVATNAGGTTHGGDEVVTTPSASSPFAETREASSVGKTIVTLNGVIDPEMLETKYHFEYGASISYGKKTSEISVAAGASELEESKSVGSLTANTLYHYRIVATNSDGTMDGADQVFTTLPNAPENTAPPVASPETPDQAAPESAATGTWTNEPTSYTYQWQRCNAAGAECKSISGATRSTYTPTETDLEHTLAVKVTATNAGGSKAATSAATKTVRRIGWIGEYTLGTEAKPFGVTAGPDGNIWFTNVGTSKIGKTTPVGTVTEYALPEKSYPTAIAAGPDGNLWFTDYLTSKIGKITPEGTITEYSAPAQSAPADIVAGPENDLWYTEAAINDIGKITTSGTIKEYGPMVNPPEQIAVGPDGNLWFGNYGRSPEDAKLSKMTPAGKVTEYTVASPGQVTGLTAGPGKEEALWYTRQGQGDKTAGVGKITTSGTVTEYTLPENSEPNGIAVGADGNLWFTESKAAKIVRMTTAGTMTEYSLPEGSFPWEIAPGPDNNLWFTDYGAARRRIAAIAP